MRIYKIALFAVIALLGCTSINPKNQEIDFHIPKEFFPTYKEPIRLTKSRVIQVLSKEASRDEFQVVYLPKKELLINVTQESTLVKSKANANKLEGIIDSEEEFILIHNHNDKELQPDSEKFNPLYWIAASPKDLEQYLAIGERCPSNKFSYGIITKFGLLTLRTDRTIFDYLNNPHSSPQIRRMIWDESQNIQNSLKRHTPASLGDWAKSYRGIFSLSFERSNQPIK